MIPNSIKQYRPKGTEIQEKSGHYYVHKVKAYYDKKTKKSRRKTLGCIGQIYEGIGFIPNNTKVVKECIAKEYGATRLIMQLTNDIFEKLRECFPTDFLRIYTLAVLKLLNNITQKDMNMAYARSAISELLPEIHLSKNTLSDFLAKLSFDRENMLRFMREYLDCKGDSIIFDGSSFLSGSKENPFTSKGYSPGNIGKSQIRLIYAFNNTDRMPIYFRVIPGNITDKVAFVASMTELKSADCTAVLDKGFYSKTNINFMLDAVLFFIISLPKNYGEIKEEDRSFDASEQQGIRFFTYHRRIIFYKEIPSKQYKNCKVCIFYDNERRKDLIENFYNKKQNEDGELPIDIQADLYNLTKNFGVSLLLTNLDHEAEMIYHHYKTRWDIEEMFDHHKNTLGFDMRYETRQEVQEAWAFVEYLSLLMYYKLDGVLTNNNLLKTYNVKDILFHASSIIQTRVDNKWILCNLTEKFKTLFETIGVTLVPIP
jgi:hypothetical protein